MPSKNPNIAVVLFQLGGPDSVEAVEPFLYNLFKDPDIIDFPFAKIAREPLARFIASRRSNKVRSYYKRIGGKSPIGELTNLQALALERELQRSVEARVFVAMRYWHPLTAETVEEIQKERFREIVLLPLYPQYSVTTTGSSLNEWNRRFRADRQDRLPVKLIKEFYDHPLYIEAIVDNINGTFKRLEHGGAGDVHIVFSAHGVPVKVIEQGDPYKGQIEATVRLVMERGGWKNPHHVCYQSKVGPAAWLRPSLDETIHALASSGVKKLLVIPISFVTEHIETLHEINIEARTEAKHLGIQQFEMMPALNDHPIFIRALADLVLRQIPIVQERHERRQANSPGHENNTRG